MTTISLRLDSVLVKEAEREATIENRSKARQVEYWAKLGKAISSQLSLADAFTVAQGIKKIKLEPIQPKTIESNDVFSDLENDRRNGTISQKVTSARIYYEASQSNPGCLEKIDSATGKRQIGVFEDGNFRAIR
jgi:hypothetical protein